MVLTDANPAFGLAEQDIMLEMNEIDGFGTIWIDSDTFDFRPWRTQALELKNLVLGAPETSEFFQVPKMLWKRHNWIAELRTFKCAKTQLFSSDGLRFPGHFGIQNWPKIDE